KLRERPVPQAALVLFLPIESTLAIPDRPLAVAQAVLEEALLVTHAVRIPIGPEAIRLIVQELPLFLQLVRGSGVFSLQVLTWGAAQIPALDDPLALAMDIGYLFALAAIVVIGHPPSLALVVIVLAFSLLSIIGIVHRP